MSFLNVSDVQELKNDISVRPCDREPKILVQLCAVKETGLLLCFTSGMQVLSYSKCFYSRPLPTTLLGPSTSGTCGHGLLSDHANRHL